MSFSIRRVASAKAPSPSISPPSPPTFSTRTTTPTPPPLLPRSPSTRRLCDLVGRPSRQPAVPRRPGARRPQRTTPVGSAARHPPCLRRHPRLDRPQRRRRHLRPARRGPAADALRTVLEVADHVIVPIETEPLSFDPTARTIRKILEPRGIPYSVVINNWDPRDGKLDLEETKTSSERTSGRSPRRSSGITNCTLGPAPTVWS